MNVVVNLGTQKMLEIADSIFATLLSFNLSLQKHKKKGWRVFSISIQNAKYRITAQNAQGEEEEIVPLTTIDKDDITCDADMDAAVSHLKLFDSICSKSLP